MKIIVEFSQNFLIILKLNWWENGYFLYDSVRFSKMLEIRQLVSERFEVDLKLGTKL